MKTELHVVYEVWIWSRKSERHEAFEGLSIEFLSVICTFENFSVCI